MTHFRSAQRARLAIGTALGATFLAIPQLASAQSAPLPSEAAAPSAATEAADPKLNEIVVTAQRSRSTVQKVPLAVSAFDERAIASKQINDVVTLIKNVPNFSGANNITLPTAVSLFLRGIGSTDSSVSADPPVGLYIDDVIVARQQLNNAGVFDLQRVEVLRGPQGTLYGRNTAAGAIKLISNPPVNRTEGWLEGAIGNYGALTGRGVLNLPLVDGKLMARANFLVSGRDGFTQNLTTGHDVNNLESSSFRGALRFVASDAVEVNVKADMSRVFSNGIVGVDVAGVYVPATGDLFKVHSGHEPFNVGKTHGLNGYLDWQLGGGLTFKSISGYRYTYQNYALDLSDQPVPAYINASTSRTRQYTQEFQLLGELGPRLNFVGGLYYMREKADQIFGPQTFRNYSKVGGVFPAPGTPNVPRDTPFVYSEEFLLKTTSYAAYLQAAYALTDQLKLEVGARYTTDTKDYTVSAVQGPVGAPTFLFDTASVIAATGQQPHKKFSQFTPHFGLNYQITPVTLAYLSYTRGFQAGNFFGRVRSPAGLIAYNATIVTSYEAGLKTMFLDGRGRFNAAAFYSKQKDLPTSYASLSRPGTFAVASLNPIVWGVEIESALRLAPGLTVNAALGWLDYKYDQFDAIPIEVRRSLGRNLRFSPHYTAKMGLEYATKLSNDWGVRLSNNYAYSSKQFTNTGNTAAGISKARVLVDAAIGVESPGDRYSMTLSCANCTNKVYVANSVDFGGARGGGLPVSVVYPGDPRTWQLAFRAKF